MRNAEIARIARALRRRRGWRQEDVAVRAGLHRATVSLVERGRFSNLTLNVIRRCIEALEAQVELTARWRGAELDRLLDEQHSWLQAAWKARLERWGWQVVAEASFNHYGDRGRIDLLAWHPALRALLVGEVKTEIVDSQALLGALDVKLRVAPLLSRRLGWGAPSEVVPMIVITDRTTNRDRVERIWSLFSRFQRRGRAAVSWLRRPDAPARGLLIYSDCDLRTRSALGTWEDSEFGFRTTTRAWSMGVQPGGHHREPRSASASREAAVENQFRRPGAYQSRDGSRGRPRREWPLARRARLRGAA